MHITKFPIFLAKKSSRCPKLDGYAIANFGVRVEREVVKKIHHEWSSGVVKWSSGGSGVV